MPEEVHKFTKAPNLNENKEETWLTVDQPRHAEQRDSYDLRFSSAESEDYETKSAVPSFIRAGKNGKRVRTKAE